MRKKILKLIWKDFTTRLNALVGLLIAILLAIPFHIADFAYACLFQMHTSISAAGFRSLQRASGMRGGAIMNGGSPGAALLVLLFLMLSSCLYIKGEIKDAADDSVEQMTAVVQEYCVPQEE